jgi:hypothetical protein
MISRANRPSIAYWQNEKITLPQKGAIIVRQRMNGYKQRAREAIISLI